MNEILFLDVLRRLREKHFEYLQENKGQEQDQTLSFVELYPCSLNLVSKSSN